MKLARTLIVVALFTILLSPGLARSQTLTPIACGDGRFDTILDDFDTATGSLFTADATIPNPVVTTTTGCDGTAVSITYDLSNIAPPGSSNDGQSWVVWRRTLPTEADISSATHLRVALRGGNENSHETVEIKLADSDGTLSVISLYSLTDLPVWRPVYVDLRELSDLGNLDRGHIAHVEIGIVRCENCEAADNPSDPSSDEHTGTLFVDELIAVNLAPGATHRIEQTAVATVTPNDSVRAAAAAALLNQVSSSGPGANLIPAWFPEANANPNYNTFAQAEALLVFVYEYENTANTAYRDAANNLADKLIDLQIENGKEQAGAWFTAYTVEGNALVPPNLQCDGNETIVADIDRCQWVGNVGWTLIALSKLDRSGIYPAPGKLQTAINNGADWIAGQSAYRNMQATYPDLISLGMEGNISAYFGLLAANRNQAAAKLGTAILQYGWDDEQQRMLPGVDSYATALDVSGSWGATFLRSIGESEKALASQGYTASIMQTSSFDNSIVGYGDIAGPWTVAVEFSAQGAASGLYGADEVMTELYKLQIPSSNYADAFPGGSDHWSGGQLRPWTTTMPGVSPTAWVYFALNGNPIWITRTYLPFIVR